MKTEYLNILFKFIINFKQFSYKKSNLKKFILLKKIMINKKFKYFKLEVFFSIRY